MALVLTLAEMLREQARLKNGYKRLADDIRRAYGDRIGQPNYPKCPLDRRKLKRLAEPGSSGGQGLFLATVEIEALDAYFAAQGRGLAEIAFFRREGFLRGLAGREIACFIGARPRGVRHDLSVWDVRALALLQQAVKDLQPYPRFSIEDVVFGQAKLTDLKARLRSLPNDAWACSIGSPRASMMSELMLRLMFSGTARRAPFRFLWAEQGNRVRSKFAVPTNKILREQRAELHEGNRGLLVRDDDTESETPFFLRWKDRVPTDYGIVAAQRQGSGQVWVVLAGLSGPATRACASVLADLGRRSELQPLSGSIRGEPTPVLYAIVEARLAVDRRRRLGDNRELREHIAIVGPKYWLPS